MLDCLDHNTLAPSKLSIVKRCSLAPLPPASVKMLTVSYPPNHRFKSGAWRIKPHRGGSTCSVDNPHSSAYGNAATFHSSDQRGDPQIAFYDQPHRSWNNENYICQPDASHCDNGIVNRCPILHQKKHAYAI